MPKQVYRLRIKLDLGGCVIGPGKAELMRKIDTLGSISAAARDMGLNYRRALFLLSTISEPLGKSVVLTEKGGATKGGAKLSTHGQEILKAYDACVKTTQTKTAPILKGLQKSLNTSDAPV